MLVETVRRYSKQPHVWRTSKRLAKLLDRGRGQEAGSEPVAGPSPHVHKLSQRLTAETIGAMQQAYLSGASLAELQQQFSLSRGSV